MLSFCTVRTFRTYCTLRTFFPMHVLVVDVGGTQIKVRATSGKQVVKIPSGPAMTPRTMVKDVRDATASILDSTTFADVLNRSKSADNGDRVLNYSI